MNIAYSNEIKSGDLFPFIRQTVEFAYRKLEMTGPLKISHREAYDSIAFQPTNKRIVLPANEFEFILTRDSYPHDFRFIILHEVAHAMQDEKEMLQFESVEYDTVETPNKLKCEIKYRNENAVFSIDDARRIISMNIFIWQNSQKFLIMPVQYDGKIETLWYQMDGRSLKEVIFGRKFAVTADINNFTKLLTDENVTNSYNDLPWEEHADETAGILLPELLEEYPDTQWPKSFSPYKKSKPEIRKENWQYHFELNPF